MDWKRGLPYAWKNTGNLLTMFPTCRENDGLWEHWIGSQKTLDDLAALLTRGIRWFNSCASTINWETGDKVPRTLFIGWINLLNLFRSLQVGEREMYIWFVVTDFLACRSHALTHLLRRVIPCIYSHFDSKMIWPQLSSCKAALEKKKWWVAFFSCVPFFRSKSVVKNCFTGQSPGTAISIPAAPDAHGNQAKSKPRLLRGGLGDDWREKAGRGPPRNRDWTLAWHEILHQWNGRIQRCMGTVEMQTLIWNALSTLFEFGLILHCYQTRASCIGTLVGAHGLDARNILGTTSLQISAASKIYLHGRWLLGIMICGVQCFLNFLTCVSADVYRKEFHICSPVPETGCPIGHTVPNWAYRADHWPFTYYIQHTTYYLLHTTYYILHITYYILHTTYEMIHPTYYIRHPSALQCFVSCT